MNISVPRRAILAGAASFMASPVLLRPEPAAAAGFSLSNFTANWGVHKGAASANVVQIADGIRADTPSTVADIEAGQVALWSRSRVAGEWTISFGYKVLSRLSDPGGTFCCFYFNGEGDGSSKYPVSIADWKGVKVGDSVYFRNSHGLRFSFATYNPEKSDLHQRLRLRRYDSSNGPFIGGQSPQVFPFTTGVPYLVAVTRNGSKLTVEVTDKNTSKKQSYSWTDGVWIPKWRDGFVGFRWRGQDAEVTGFAVKQL